MADRVRPLNDAPLGDGAVVYWMSSQRRLHWNHALDHAALHAVAHGKPLVIVEPLRIDTPYASLRTHRFIQQGMLDHAVTSADEGIAYHPFIESAPGEADALLHAYAANANLVVVDDVADMQDRELLAAAALPVRVEAVDSIGILPLAATDKAYVSAYQFRRFLQNNMVSELTARPAEEILDMVPQADLLEDILAQWPVSDVTSAPDVPVDPIPPVTETPGGREAALVRLDAFASNIDRYPERNHPDAHAESALSPYLRHGHIAAAEVVWLLLEQEDWHPGRLGKSNGQRAGWWGLSEGAEAFLDQVITWRELGHVEARHNPAYRRFDSLPGWAQETLAQHDGDRSQPYALEVLEAAGSGDPLWDAAQRQLLEAGVIHNYMRMLWGKKILEWAPDARTAFEWMLHLNDKYALDGGDPNSVSGVAWCLGRYDRPWQERQVFGKVRCMTSDSARRKLRLDGYLAQWGKKEETPATQ